MVNIGKELQKEFELYSKLNEIGNTEEFIVKCTKDGLTLDKYGVAPFLPKSQIQEVPVVKEIIKEVIREVLVEKEVIVEKIITREIDNIELLGKLEEYKKIVQEKDEQIKQQQNKIKEQDDVLEHFKNVTVNRRAKYMKTSNLDDTNLD